ncbi:MAG: hypothetical protein ABIG68_12730, partial [Acidobacteriota bacterium]
KKRTKQWWYPYRPENLLLMENTFKLLHHKHFGQRLKSLLSLLPRIGEINSTTPFRSLFRITSRLFRR